jgi:hypothetical protein
MGGFLSSGNGRFSTWWKARQYRLVRERQALIRGAMNTQLEEWREAKQTHIHATMEQAMVQKNQAIEMLTSAKREKRPLTTNENMRIKLLNVGYMHTMDKLRLAEKALEVATVAEQRLSEQQDADDQVLFYAKLGADLRILQKAGLSSTDVHRTAVDTARIFSEADMKQAAIKSGVHTINTGILSRENYDEEVEQQEDEDAERDAEVVQRKALRPASKLDVASLAIFDGLIDEDAAMEQSQMDEIVHMQTSSNSRTPAARDEEDMKESIPSYLR